MTDTANLALPCIEGSQAQKHVTHNEALRLLDTLVQLAVLDRDLNAPPGAPAEGQRWIVKTGATGAWAGHGNAVAAWQDGAWQFASPRLGWLAYVTDESVLLAWSGSAWVAGGRTVLAANRTFYVRADGSDSNDGSANDSGHAFLTIQKAIDVFATSIDLAGYAGTIAVADGTYTAPVAVTRPFVGGAVTLSGNIATPANVIISTTSSSAIMVTGAGAAIIIEGLELRTTTSGNTLFASFGGQITVGQAMRFGACASSHMNADTGGIINLTQSYSIVGSATGSHWIASWLGVVNAPAAITITLTATPSFAQFAFSRAGLVRCPAKTFSGAATGARYLVDNNGVIFTGGAGATYLPGSSSGSGGTSSGGGVYN